MSFPNIDVKFKPGDTFNIVGHKVYLQLALDNLISNAFKYASTQVNVQLERKVDSIAMIVEDDGPGIPKDKINEVLLPFSRLDESRSKTKSGFGLGLPIANAALQKHNASLQLSPSEMGGLKAQVMFEV